MLFSIVCTDRPGALDLRLATRPAHLAFLETYQNKLMHAGAMLDLDGRPCGSILIVDVEDRAAAEGFAAADPYAVAGLFAEVEILPWRWVIGLPTA